MIQLYKGDCLIESDKIESGSVDLILTDLPYGTVKGAPKNWTLKNESGHNWDNVIDTNEVYNIANRILRKNGKIVLFCQEPFTTELVTKAIANIPFCYRMIWEKDDFANALLSKKAPVNYYEDILVFSKLEDTDFKHPLRDYAIKVLKWIKEPRKSVLDCIGMGNIRFFRIKQNEFAKPTKKAYDKIIELFEINQMEGFLNYDKILKIDAEYKKQYASTFNLWEGKKYKSNILKYKKDYDGYHPTQKPVLLLEDLIKTFSNPKDLVVDLTMGSGSTGVACLNTGRDFIGIEQDEKYYDIAKTRIEVAGRQSSIVFPTQ